MNIGVLYGGMSCEHEISIITSKKVIDTLKEKYDVIPIYVSKDNEFFVKGKICKFSKGKIGKIPLDVAVLCFHGGTGEDGKIASLLWLNDIPYTSSNPTSLAVCQDKIFTKSILKSNNIRVVKTTKKAPCIIKPANLGSSIGIKVAYTNLEMEEMIKAAKAYDQRILVEEYLSDYKELNIGVITDGQNYCFSNIEEVHRNSEFLNFEDKYLHKQGLKERIVDTELKRSIEKIAKRVCKALDVRGVVRIDFLVTDKIYVNELNSIPGSLCYYLWDFSYLELLERIMKIAIIEFQKKKHIITEYESGALKLNEKK